MELDPVLFDTYKRYKSGTGKVVSWITTLARKTGLVDDLFVDPKLHALKPIGRLKGKARKIATAKGPLETSVSVSHITTTQLLRMVEAIGKKAIVVPEVLISTLNEVIAARKECAGWFACQQDGLAINADTQASNTAHQHFIDILRSIKKILVEHVRPSTTKFDTGRTRNPKSTNVEDMANLFECLDVEDPAEWTTRALPTKSTTSAITYELEASDEDLPFAIFCLLKDLTEIRRFVRQTWAEYREHLITLTTAAETMNTSITLLRHLNEEFLANFPQCSEHKNIINYMCSQHMADENFQYCGDGFRLPVSILLCVNTHAALEWFMDAKMNFYRPQDDLDPTEDEQVLFKCLSLFGLIIFSNPTGFFNDKLVEGLNLIKEDKKIYTWVVFALQLFVDTRRVVGKELDRSLEEFHNLRRWLIEATTGALRYAENLQSTEQQKQNVATLHAEIKYLTLLEEDLIQNSLAWHFQDRAKQYSWGPFFLFRNHPMVIGIIMQKCLMQYHMLSVSIVSDQSIVLTVCHLYNAVQQSDPAIDVPDWADMENLVESQAEGPTWLFYAEHPDRPKTEEKCHKFLSLAIGVSAVAAGKNRHGESTFRFNKGLPRSKSNGRRVTHTSKYFGLCFELGNGKKGTDSYKEKGALLNPAAMLEMIIAADSAKKFETSSTGQKKIRDITRNQPKLSPPAMLLMLKTFLKEDEAAFRFDFWALNYRCIELLRKLQPFCHEVLSDPRLLEVSIGDQYIKEIPWHILGHKDSFSTKIFKMARTLVQEIVNIDGSTELTNAEGRRFLAADDINKVVDKWVIPPEDHFSLVQRAAFGQMTVVGDGNFIFVRER